jgi:hypothetical protein
MWDSSSVVGSLPGIAFPPSRRIDPAIVDV